MTVVEIEERYSKSLCETVSRWPGLGMALLQAAEEYLRARGVEYLQVKTLGPSDPDEGYRRTRAFCAARGFVALEEIHGLWEHNPCLLMVKRL
ncbi:MAG: hypothetical protein ABW012_05310 [Gaiellaceae bacterium]